MPKMEPESITQKISLDRIIDTGNIREQKKYGPDENGNFPEDVRELGESIKKNGLIEPIIVKAAGDDGNDIKQYELIAGFRRRAAFQYLCGQKLDFNLIEAKIVSGDKLTIQLIENIQRVDLSAIERERAIFQMAESGVKQNEIAAQLSKSKSYVSIHISAYRIRAIAAKNNIDTEKIETSTLSELLSIPDIDLPEVLKELVNFGGTRAAAKELVQSYQNKKNPPLDMGTDDLNIDMDSGPGNEGEERPEEKAPPPEPATEPAPGDDSERESAPPLPDEPAPGAAPAPDPEKPKRPEPLVRPPRPEPDYDPIETEHAQIDVNIILNAIHDYIDAIKKKLPDKGVQSLTEAAKIEAANDIIALIHEGLNRA